MTKQRFENAARFDFLPSSCKLEECALRVACTISTILKKSKEREKNKNCQLYWTFSDTYILTWKGKKLEKLTYSEISISYQVICGLILVIIFNIFMNNFIMAY